MMTAKSNSISIQSDAMSGQPEMTLEHLQAFGDAWAKKGIDSLVQFITDDCEYHASVGPEPGERFIGKDEVRRGFQAMLDHDAGNESLPGNLYVYGDRRVAEWTLPVNSARAVSNYDHESESVSMRPAHQ